MTTTRRQPVSALEKMSYDGPSCSFRPVRARHDALRATRRDHAQPCNPPCEQPATRAAVADHGKALPTELTDAGRKQLRAASVAVRAIEKQMLAPLTPNAQQRLRADLGACAAALTA